MYYKCILYIYILFLLIIKTFDVNGRKIFVRLSLGKSKFIIWSMVAVIVVELCVCQFGCLFGLWLFVCQISLGHHQKCPKSESVWYQMWLTSTLFIMDQKWFK